MKALHNEIAERGADYLMEIELGNAPPLEYLVRNLQQQYEGKQFPSEEMSTTQVFNEVMGNIQQE